MINSATNTPANLLDWRTDGLLTIEIKSAALFAGSIAALSN
jgi:hypothetical protein